MWQDSKGRQYYTWQDTCKGPLSLGAFRGFWTCKQDCRAFDNGSGGHLLTIPTSSSFEIEG